MSMTAEQLRQAVLRETGLGYGPQNGVYAIDARDTTTVTIGELANTNLSGEESINMWAFLPDAATATDREKPLAATTVATGVLANAGAAWGGSGSAADQCEIMRYISPVELFNLTVETLQQFAQRVLTPLGTFVDSDMDTTVDGTSYTATSSTLSKVSTAVNTHSGVKALFVSVSGGNGQAQGATITASPGQPVWVSAVVRADVGTAVLTLYDVTNSAVIATITSTSERFVHLWLQTTYPATCEEAAVIIAGVGASDRIYCDHIAGPYETNSNWVRAPSWADEAWRVKKLRRAYYRKSLGGGIDDAYSREFQDVRGDQFTYENIPGNTHENKFVLENTLPTGDLWMEAERRAYDLTSTTWANTAAGEAYTTGAPRDELIYAVSERVLSYLRDRNPNVVELVSRYDTVSRKLNAIYAAREAELPPKNELTSRVFTAI